SNDVLPTAMPVATHEAIERDLVPALETLRAALREKAGEFHMVVKTARTHLQDATPERLGQEFGGYRSQISKGISRVSRTIRDRSELALGCTAVGSGLNSLPDFPELTAEKISDETGLPFEETVDHFEAQAAHDAMTEAHGAL